MAVKERVLTAPLAIVKVGGVAIGKMKNLRVRETVRRLPVQGLGQLNKDELAAVDWSGSLTCSFYNIRFSISQIPGAMLRNVSSIEDWANTVLLQEDGVQIDLMRKVKDTVQGNGIITAKLEIFASVTGCFLTNESFDVNEGQISGRDQEFEYLSPILFPL